MRFPFAAGDYAIPIEWNYGAFPQTWEQPDHAWAGLEALASKGDNDPLDLVDLSVTRVESGAVIEVKPLGVLAMIDEGEVDWKVLVINAADPKAALVNCLDDVEAHFPGQIARVREWFTWYVLPTWPRPPSYFLPLPNSNHLPRLPAAHLLPTARLLLPAGTRPSTASQATARSAQTRRRMPSPMSSD